MSAAPPPGLPLGRDDAAHARLLDRLGATAEGAALLAHVAGAPGLPELLRGIAAGSDYLAGLIVHDPRFAQEALTLPPEGLLAECIAAQHGIAHCADLAAAMRALRRIKHRTALVVALADLRGLWDTPAVIAALSRAADAAIAAAVAFVSRPAEAASSGLFILAMGKLGAGELNYSSDVDLVAFYDPAAAARHGSDPGRAFVRQVRDMTRLLSEATAEGYAYRVDLRLRPDPGATQVAMSTDAALHYYEQRGQNWERAAFIKARVVAGDMAAGHAFLERLAPFIWRKFLDYNAIADIHAMKRQIHAHKGHGAVAVAGHDLKLGRGGIREIEFFVQTQQLIAGGRQPALRPRGTLAALDALAARGWIDAPANAALAACYIALRHLENRLQMMDDAQTHRVPREPARYAAFAGYPDEAAFAASLTRTLTTVQTHYAALFERAPGLAADGVGDLVFTGDTHDAATLETLAQLGFRAPEAASAIVRGWHFGRVPAMRSARARERLTEITPSLLRAVAATGEPDQALAQFDAFVAALPSGVQLFSLLGANPDLLARLLFVMRAAPRLAGILARKARLVEALLAGPGDVTDAAAVHRELETELAPARSYEQALDRIRVAVQERQFGIGAAQLDGALPAATAGLAYSALADAAIAALLPRVRAELAMPDDTAILALGRLGSREMTATSDLDLIIVYAQGGEGRALPSPAHARFASRFIAALSSPTAEGRAYEVDMRLRPSGRAGPVATSLSAFAAYHAHDAWTWEHMALTRARVVAGPPELAAALAAIIRNVLTRPRNAALIAADVRGMRARIAAEKGDSNGWNLKLAAGGQLDIDFIAQYLQLAHAARQPALLAGPAAAVLAEAAAARVLGGDDARGLIAAAALFEQVTQILRLTTEGFFVPATAAPGAIAALCRLTGMPSLAVLEATLADHRRRVRAAFERIVA